MIRVGSLCSGYEGLSLSLALAGVDHELAWVADSDPAAAMVLAYRYPNVPNLGDIKAIDWHAVERVDLLATGFPCTDLSLAGLGAGIALGTRSGLWLDIVRGIAILRPQMILIENVRGLLSARAHSDVEPCPWCLGDRGGQDQEPVLRALGAVLGDLSELGYDAEWVTVAASDVGAAHRRERVFVYAYPADAEGSRLEAGRQGRAGECTVADAPGIGHGHTGPQVFAGIPAAAVASGDTAGGLTLLPTPRASANENRQTKRTPSQEAGTHGLNLAAEVCALLPTPRATHGTHGGPNQRGSSGDLMLPAAVQPGRWGLYGAAIERWEHVMGRPAPEPTEPSPPGARRPGVRLAPRFVEWLMGLPDGWVCDVPGLYRNDMLRLLGNGVVRQQAAYAWHLLTSPPSRLETNHT